MSPPVRLAGTVGPAAPSPEEAAAIAVALEQFRRERAPVPAPAVAAATPVSAWKRAALREGVTRGPGAAP